MEPMHRKIGIGLALLMWLCSCGSSDNSKIVGLMVSPVSATATVGSAADFSAALQYVDGHTKSVSNVKWSTQGTAILIFGTLQDGSVSVNCVRRSDYFAGGYVGDTVMAQAEAGGQAYVGTASLACE